MKATGPIAALLALAALSGACACPRCPKETFEGVGVVMPAAPNGAERGAISSVIQLLAVGGDSLETNALSTGLATRRIVIGAFATAPRANRIRGYALMKDGRLALQDFYVRSTPPDSSYLKNPRTWPLIPIIYAAGVRLAGSGDWAQSIAATKEFMPKLAERIRSGEAAAALPPGTNTKELARSLMAWGRTF